MMNKPIAKWMSLAAVLLFTAATFQITSDHVWLGMAFLGGASCFACAARKYHRKKEQDGEIK